LKEDFRNFLSLYFFILNSEED